MQDLVSIIIPYYKKKSFFQKTIDSVKKQSYKNYEIILIYDDKSKLDLLFVGVDSILFPELIPSILFSKALIFT